MAGRGLPGGRRHPRCGLRPAVSGQADRPGRGAVPTQRSTRTRPRGRDPPFRSPGGCCHRGRSRHALVRRRCEHWSASKPSDWFRRRWQRKWCAFRHERVQHVGVVRTLVVRPFLVRSPGRSLVRVARRSGRHATLSALGCRFSADAADRPAPCARPVRSGGGLCLFAGPAGLRAAAAVRHAGARNRRPWSALAPRLGLVRRRGAASADGGGLARSGRASQSGTLRARSARRTAGR